MLENFQLSLKKWFINLSAEVIYSAVALRTLVLAFASSELLPKRRVLIKIGSQRCRRLSSMFFMVLRRICLSVICMGRWRRKCAVDSISKLQLQNGFKESWKLFLNLFSLKYYSVHATFIPAGRALVGWYWFWWSAGLKNDISSIKQFSFNLKLFSQKCLWWYSKN